MSGDKPQIRILSTPASVQKSMWEHELDRVRGLADYSQIEQRILMVAEQSKLKRGDLVEWSPTGQRGLWIVTDVHRYHDAAMMTPAQVKEVLHDALAEGGETLVWGGRKVIQRDVPRGKVRLEWWSGWGGYANDRRPVVVKIEEVQKLNAMETIALAAK